LLELRKRRRVVVLTIHDQQDSAALISRSAVEYLSKHGYDASASPLAGNSAIESLISVTATQMGAGLIVAGAYGHQRLRELFLGSTTRRLIESCKTPLFIHH
jgi:nucleotide-binding universal stress UspA family protein